MSVFIVAELSANHLGSLDRAMRLVDAAHDAGADAVKLQTWWQMALPGYVIESGPWAGRDLADLYDEAATPWEWHQPIFDRCKELGMVGFSSVFDAESLEFLESIGCPIYKIASFEITDIPLIESVAGTGKPVILSTGMASMEEIRAAVGVAGRDVTVLKCTSHYPASPDSINLAALKTLQEALPDACIGLSDHTLGVGVPAAAVALGARVIEKHLTLSRADGGPDAGFSSEPGEFRAMVRACRDADLAVGSAVLGPGSDGANMYFRRGLYAVRPIRAGDTIERDNVRSLRPALGIAPAMIAAIIGRRAARDIPVGPITMGDI